MMQRNLDKVLNLGWQIIGSLNYDAMRDACKSDLFFLLRFMCNMSFIEHQWWLDRCDEVQENPNGYLDLWSREHGKSTIITYGKSIQDILIDPEISIGIFSFTRPAAKMFLKQIKREFEQNDRLKELFSDVLYNEPKKESPSWSEDGGIIVRRKGNPRESTVEAWGLLDGQPTGKHFRLMVFDDVVTRDSVTTEEMRSNAVTALELSYNLSGIGGNMRMIGTRYHFDDAYATVIKRGSFTPRIRRCQDANGNSLLFTQETLIRKRADMGPVTFASQMMLDPLSDSAISFKRQWLRFYIDPSNVRGNNYILVDPANSKTKKGDYTSIVVICAGEDRNYYVLDIVRDRLSLLDRCDLLIDLHKQYEPMEIYYEEYGMNSDIQAIEMRMEHMKYRFRLTPIGNRGSLSKTAKPERIQWLLPVFEQSRLWLPKVLYRHTRDSNIAVDMVSSFVNDEYSAWPSASHDDMLDVLSRIRDPEVRIVFPKTAQAEKRLEQRRSTVAVGTGTVIGFGRPSPGERMWRRS